VVGALLPPYSPLWRGKLRAKPPTCSTGLSTRTRGRQDRCAACTSFTIRYHPRPDSPDAPNLDDRMWSDGTLIYDTQEDGYVCADQAHHGYEVCQAVMERGDEALTPIMSWPDEVWVAIDIGDIESHKPLQQGSLRDVMERVQVLQPSRTWPPDA